MVKITLILFVFLSLLFLNFSSIYGDSVCKDALGKPLGDDFYPNHRCEKIGSNYCYFPTDLSLAPFFDSKVVIPGPILSPILSPILTQKFPSIYGGCSLSLSGRVLLTGLDVYELREFVTACGKGGFEFGTNVNYRYLLYRKDNIVKMGGESERKILGTFPFEKEKFRDSVEGGGNFLERGIYTLRVRAEIKDNKCSGRPERDIYPINVFTNLDLDLKLNNAGRIVYDDEETQKIEIVPGQDRFTFQGTTFSRDDILKDSEGDEITLGQGKITIKESS